MNERTVPTIRTKHYTNLNTQNLFLFYLSSVFCFIFQRNINSNSQQRRGNNQQRRRQRWRRRKFNNYAENTADFLWFLWLLWKHLWLKSCEVTRELYKQRTTRGKEKQSESKEGIMEMKGHFKVKLKLS